MLQLSPQPLSARKIALPWGQRLGAGTGSARWQPAPKPHRDRTQGHRGQETERGHQPKSPKTQRSLSHNGPMNVSFISGNHFWQFHGSLCAWIVCGAHVGGGYGKGLLARSILLCRDPAPDPRTLEASDVRGTLSRSGIWVGGGPGSCLDVLGPHVPGPHPSECPRLLNSRETPDVLLCICASTL